MVSFSDRDLARFWRKVARGGPSECWRWVGARERGSGRGNLLWRGRVSRASRVAWEVEHGQPPRAGAYVCHACDHPWCVNPSHLFLGTAADNTHDMLRKGRGRPHASRLTWEKVREIRSLRGAYRQGEVARRYGIPKQRVWEIWANKAWREVPSG